MLLPEDALLRLRDFWHLVAPWGTVGQQLSHVESRRRAGAVNDHS